MKKLFSLICLVAAAFPNFSAVYAEENRRQESAYGNSSEVSFRLYQEYLILVKGSIGPFQNLTFLIDTGATTTVLSSHLASKLKLKRSAGRAAAYGKAVSIETAIVRRLSLGSVLFHAVPVVIPRAFSMPSDLQLVDAIVGLNVLKRSDFSIDYESKTIRFGPVDHFASTVPFSSDHYLLVRISVGSKTLNLAVDSGAKDLILYERRVKKLESAIPTGERKTFQHFGGSNRLNGVTLPRVQLGDVSWVEVAGFLLRGEQWDAYPKGVDGVIGLAALKLRRLHFDFQNGVLSWEGSTA